MKTKPTCFYGQPRSFAYSSNIVIQGGFEGGNMSAGDRKIGFRAFFLAAMQADGYCVIPDRLDPDIFTLVRGNLQQRAVLRHMGYSRRQPPIDTLVDGALLAGRGGIYVTNSPVTADYKRTVMQATGVDRVIAKDDILEMVARHGMFPHDGQPRYLTRQH